MVSMTAGPATAGPHQGKDLTGHVHGRESLSRTKCSPEKKACTGGGRSHSLSSWVSEVVSTAYPTGVQRARPLSP